MSDWEDFCEANGWSIGSSEDYESFLDSLEDTTQGARPMLDDAEKESLDKQQALLILRNLIARIDKEEMSLSYITPIEYSSLRFLIATLSSLPDQSLSADSLLADNFDDDIPF